MLVSDLMKTEIVFVQPENTLADAARMMLLRHVSGLPVLDGGELVGILTEGDLLRRVEIGTAASEHSWLKAFFLPASLASEYIHSHGRYVRDVMTTSPVSVAPDTELADVADLMISRHIKRVPVLEEGVLVGIVSRSDLLRVLARKLIDTCDPFSEIEIRDHILSTLAHESWAPKKGIRVSVVGNAVHLEGAVFSDAERHAIRVIAETTPGVKEVKDDIVFIDPTSGFTVPAA